MTRYELLDRIGVGGMAEIFRGKAVAAGGFEKPVAIKRILPHLSQDKRFVELLIAEAKVLSLLKHRNIVQIFDVGLGDDGKYFLVMEYVDGKDLGGIQKALETKRRRIPFDLALHIGAEICEALEHAHSARAPDGKPMSLVHRDVSPSNVLLSRAGEVKLTDFGIAKRAEQEATGSGAVRGKFAYISPEQARNEHIDPRSDVFSVAVVLWELVTNRRLFSGLGDLEALRAVRDAKVMRPSEADPRLANKDIDELLMTALAADPKRRPTAEQFGAKLRTLRYSLETTVGDPATELAKIIENAEQVERQSGSIISSRSTGFEPEHTEATVIRIRTDDFFSMRDQDGTGMAHARQVIDRFEEEETRLAQLSGDQLRMLRGNRASRDSGEMTVPPPSPALGSSLGSGRSRRPTDEPTTTRPPMFSEEVATMASGIRDGVRDLPPNQSFDSDERTRLVAPPSRRTPAPERVKSVSVGPPLPGMPQSGSRSQPSRSRGPTGEPPMPGTVHQRHPNAGSPPQPASNPPGMSQLPLPPRLPQTPIAPSPPVLPPPPVLQPRPPVLPPTPAPGYPMWGGAPPPAQPSPYPQAPTFTADPRQLPSRTNQPALAKRKQGLQPWMLVVGALVMAALAFAVTRAFIGGGPAKATATDTK